MTKRAGSASAAGRALVLGAACVLGACGGGEWQTVSVTASAYNATEAQTKKGNIGLTAWGHQLQLGDRVIAVSRDLIAEGVGNGARVRIEGLDGVWIVRDKMNKRWTRKIDIFMGDDVRAAREWGVREVTIRWRPPPD